MACYSSYSFLKVSKNQHHKIWRNFIKMNYSILSLFDKAPCTTKVNFNKWKTFNQKVIGQKIIIIQNEKCMDITFLYLYNEKKIKFFITTLLTLDCAYLFFIKSWSDIPFFHFPYSLDSVCNENTSANSL